MLKLLTGKTGSGKSYYAVSEIIDSLDQGKNVYTNIKLSLTYSNYHYLDELGIKKFLNYIGDTFKEVDNLEEKKLEVKNTAYFNSDFYIDEAHLVGFRDKKEAVLNWLTIHRHFNQNIIVITQVPSNVHRDYLQMFHSHIDMIPQNKRLSKSSMGLREYDAYKGDRIRTTYFKPKKDLFELYNSGNIETGVNQDIAKLYMVLIGLIGIVIMLYFTASGFLDQKSLKSLNDNNNISVSVNSSVNSKKIVNNDLNNTEVLLDNTSVYFSVWCSTYSGCHFDGMQYSYDDFKMYVLTKYKSVKVKMMARLSKNNENIIRYTLLDKN